MRKLLLATAAVLGGASIASAATFPPPAGQTAVPAPVPYTLTPGPTAGPGTITVRIDARIGFLVAAGSDSGRNPGSVTTAAGSAPVGVNTKQDNYTMGEYGRIFPGFDGIAGNGLRYGAAMEIRQDNGEPTGGGVNGSISQNSRNRNTLYFRRDYAYIGTDQAGIIRMGSTDGPMTLFITGTMENYNDGGWNGDAPALFSGNTQVTWPFPDVGNIYTTSKIVYLSPQFAGFDFGFSFAPNSGNGSETPGCSYSNTVAGAVTGPVGTGSGSGCDASSSTTVAGEGRRPRNSVEAAVRYRGSFGPVGVAVEVAGQASGKVFNDNPPAVKATQVQYVGLAQGDGGAQVTFGGLTVGGNILGGQVAGQQQLLAKGGRRALAFLFGSSYAIGPIIVGASYFDYRSAGSKNTISSPWTNNLNEYGLAAGGTYNFAPGMNFFVSYLYGHRHEAGVDLLTGVASTGTTLAGKVGTHNNVQSQGIGTGLFFRW